MADRLTRREAVAAVAALVGYLHGDPVDAADPQVARAHSGGSIKGLSIDFTGISAVVLRHGERVVTVTPTEILDAIQGPASPVPLPPVHLPMGQGAPAPRRY